MSVTNTRYALGHTVEEHERLREQARRWETATGRLLDRVGLAPGARCLDAGCGPGVTMRLMARRVGPTGRIIGLDKDAALVESALAMLHESGHRQCEVRLHDLTSAQPLPEPAFDLVYARLLLFHLPERVEVLRRLWAAVAPGGYLVVHDYDLGPAGTHPGLESAQRMQQVLDRAFGAVGCDVRVGVSLPELLRQAGVGTPDDTDVTGALEPLATARHFLEQTFRSLLPVALAHGITTEQDAAQLLAALHRDATRYPERPVLLPLLIGAWKRKEQQ